MGGAAAAAAVVNKSELWGAQNGKGWMYERIEDNSLEKFNHNKVEKSRKKFYHCYCMKRQRETETERERERKR